MGESLLNACLDIGIQRVLRVCRRSTPMKSTSSSHGGFAPHFCGQEVKSSVDCELMQAIFAFRFDVYCRECGFLPSDQYPQGMESDIHDSSSAHFCATDLRQQLAGYVRLVPANEAGEFPFQAHCTRLFEGTNLPDPRQSGEISRLMVQKHYRRRRGDTLAGVTFITDAPLAQERRNDSPQILLSMFRQMYTYSTSNGIRYWYAAMERSLARALRHLGFGFHAIGPSTDYYGPVAPYLADLRELEATVGQAKPELFRWMREPMGPEHT